VLPCDARDECCAYAGEIPARAKYTRTNSIERDVGVLENTTSTLQEDGNMLKDDAPQSRQDLQ
jgi:hypothetical protein